MRIFKMLINTLANRIEEKDRNIEVFDLWEMLHLATYLAYNQLN